VCVSISARNLSFAYAPRGGSGNGRPVLRDVSLDVPAGARLGILGPNGSGKTTLLKLLAGVLSPSDGSVTLDGVPMARLPRRTVARRIAMVPQETHPAFDYTVLELVLMGRYPHLGAFEVESAADLAIAHASLKATGTEAFASRLFTTLSGGEKQRVVIASALAQQAEVLLLDEPTASLDPAYQLEVAELLRTLHRERGLGLVLSTHDLNLAAAVCDRLVLLREGVVLASGPTGDVLTGERVAALYGIDADVRYHERAGHLTVVPVGRVT
jgi:iron complex transport system ATP-binding protein